MTSQLTELSLLLEFEFGFEVLEQLDNDSIVFPENEYSPLRYRKWKSNF